MRARVSLDRITSFIANTEELDSQPRTFTSVKSSSSPSSSSPSSSSSSENSTSASNDAAIVVSPNSQFRFSRYGSGGFTLSTASSGSDQTKELRIPRGKTTLISGDVGSGKSAFLLALLGEMHVESGGVEFRVEEDEESVGVQKGGGARREDGRVKLSYAAQSPWLQDESIRTNILFGEEFDEERYNQTVFACSLEDDLEALPEGDETRVGEKGLSLSGCVSFLFSPSPSFSNRVLLSPTAVKSNESPSPALSTPIPPSSSSMTSSPPSTATWSLTSSSTA
jgi:ABC-type multidrug transport system fused ATPase/permease subunit